MAMTGSKLTGGVTAGDDGAAYRVAKNDQPRLRQPLWRPTCRKSSIHQQETTIVDDNKFQLILQHTCCSES